MVHGALPAPYYGLIMYDPLGLVHSELHYQIGTGVSNVTSVSHVTSLYRTNQAICVHCILVCNVGNFLGTMLQDEAMLGESCLNTRTWILSREARVQGRDVCVCSSGILASGKKGPVPSILALPE